jgi:crotonobetainyl-CoA:carnitine CoA-transferase CaiB-like acyl-CoA transferase
VMADPQINHRGMVMELRAADGRQARVIGNPMKLADAKSREELFPPTLGQDTIRVLRDVLNISENGIADLLKSGAVTTPQPSGDRLRAN